MLIVLHLSLMIAFTLALMKGVGMAMFGRKKKNWLKIHKTLNAAGLAGALAGAVMAFVDVIASAGRHLAGLHQWMGLAAIILCCFTLFLGYDSFKVQNKTMVRAIHRSAGRLSIMVILAALALGLRIIGLF